MERDELLRGARRRRRRGGAVVAMRRQRSAKAGPTDAVVLIPGFIGFSRIGRFYYFSERIIAALRARLEARLGRAIVVVPACTRSIDPLEARQAFLLEQLLTCDRPLGDRSWSPYDRVRRRIASVVAIAAPQRGTFLARSMAARFVANPFRHYRGFAAFADVVAEIFPVVIRHPAALDLLSGLARQIPELLALRKRIGQHGRLIEQLAPEAMAELRAHVCPLGGIVVADHGDVIGHYDRKPALLDKEPLNVGIFHSGSGFNDDAFFELYGHVADAIARAIPELQDAGEPRRSLEAI